VAINFINPICRYRLGTEKRDVMVRWALAELYETAAANALTLNLTVWVHRMAHPRIN
jgi:hypothetical protein